MPFAYERPLCADTVENVFWGAGTKFSGAADALHALRREGPHRFSEKRSWSFVSTLRSIGAGESPKNQHLRDFWPRSIFDFFNTIRQKRSSPQIALFERASAKGFIETMRGVAKC
jgi:hypothetical protein